MMARMTVRSMQMLSTLQRGIMTVTITGYVDTNEIGALERVCLNERDWDSDTQPEAKLPEMVKVEITRV